MAMFKTLLQGILALTAVALSNTATATIYVPDRGTSDQETYSYTFAEDFSGYLTIGVSDQGDYGVESLFSLFGFADALAGNADVVLSTAHGHGTNVYQNTLGEFGTDGQLWQVLLNVAAGDTLSFSWVFSSADYEPFNDFAFISFGSHYNVLAQIGVDPNPAPVPVPAPLALLGLGLVGLGFARRK